MNAGKFDKFVKFQRRSGGQGPTGQPVDGWDDIAERWVNIETLTGAESVRQSGESATATHRVTCWMVPGLTPRDRILFGGRIFDIDRAVPIYNETQLQILCTEIL